MHQDFIKLIKIFKTKIKDYDLSAKNDDLMVFDYDLKEKNSFIFLPQIDLSNIIFIIYFCIYNCQMF